MSDLRVFRNDVIDWVIAESPADATRAWEEHNGDTWENCTGDDERPSWRELANDEVLNVRDDDGDSVEKTCAEWVRDHGRGFLCSTEY